MIQRAPSAISFRARRADRRFFFTRNAAGAAPCDEVLWVDSGRRAGPEQHQCIRPDTEVLLRKPWISPRLRHTKRRSKTYKPPSYELKANPQDWEAAHERLMEAAKRCESARLAICDAE